jgi:hypothetical protein
MSAVTTGASTRKPAGNHHSGLSTASIPPASAADFFRKMFASPVKERAMLR